MEGIPFRILLTLFLAGTILTVGFYALFVFTSFQTNKSFSDSINDVNNAMVSLQSTGDLGSFTKIRVVIPDKSRLNITAGTRLLNYSLYGQNYSLNASGIFLWGRNYGPGSYELELYYGSPPPEKNESNSPYLVPFS
jgi:hypothetical protein